MIVLPTICPARLLFGNQPPHSSSGAGMVKLVQVEKKKLKISAKEHRESLKKNAAGKKVLEEEEKEHKKHLEKMKKEKEEHAD